MRALWGAREFGSRAAVRLGYAYVGSLPKLLASQYGAALVTKVVVLFGVMGFGAWNWQRLLPSLGTPDATAALRRSAGLELGVALLLVAVTAVLVALPAPAL